MSKLEELIQKYCPDGVEYRPLGEVCDIHKGVQFNKSDMKDEGVYPVMNGGINPSGYVEVFNELEDTITISQGGASAGYVNFLKSKFWLGAHCYAVKPGKTVKNRYLYHFIKGNEVTLQQCQYGAGIPALAKGTITSLEIPIPPLPIQEEIVRVLDTFTELQAELQAELQKRLQQYNYYRDHFLSFEGRTDVKWKKLEDCIKSLNTGLNPRQFFKLNTDDATNYYVTIREIQHNTVVFNEGTDRMNDAALRLCNNRSNLEKGDILFSGTGTIGEVAALQETPQKWNIKEGVYAIKPKHDILNHRFLMYLLQSSGIRQAYLKKAAGGTVKSVPMGEMKKLEIPIPSLEEQEKIASILDRFDALTTDLSAGLPAEIEKRRQQYEFYRDKLLTFKRAN